MKFKLGFFSHGAATVFYDSLTYQGTDNSTANASSYSFTSKSIGTANSDRRVIVATAVEDGADTVTAMTVGGVSATELGQINASNEAGVSLWIAAVPTGTTATIAVTLGSSASACKIGWWTVNMTSSISHEVLEATGGVGDGYVDVTSVDIPVNGFAVSVCGAFDIAGASPELTVNQSFILSGDGTIEGNFGAAFALREVTGSFSGTVRWSASDFDGVPVALIATFKGNGT